MKILGMRYGIRVCLNAQKNGNFNAEICELKSHEYFIFRYIDLCHIKVIKVQ